MNAIGTVITVRLCNIVTPSRLTEMKLLASALNGFKHLPFPLPPSSLLSLKSVEDYFLKSLNRPVLLLPWMSNKTPCLSSWTSISSIFPLRRSIWAQTRDSPFVPDDNILLACTPVHLFENYEHFSVLSLPVSLPMFLVSPEGDLLAHQEALAGLWDVIYLDLSTISGFTSRFLICLPTNFGPKNILLGRENPQKYR